MILVTKLILVVRFPLGVGPDLAQTVVGWGISETTLVVIGWILQAAIIAAMVVWAKEKTPAWLALILATNPWLNALSVFYVWETLTLLSVLTMFLSSPKWTKVVAMGTFILSLWFNRGYLIKINQDNLVSQLNLAKLSRQVDEAQKINYLATGKSYILPASLRKVVYNKPALAGRIIVNRMLGVVDFEQWTAPLSAWAVTGLSGLPPKGMLPLFYFFEVPLLLWGVSRLTRSAWLRWGGWLAAGVGGGAYLEKKFFTVGGLLLLPFALYTISRVLAQTKAVRQYLFLGLYLTSSVYLFKQVFLQQFSYRYSDAYLYRQAALWLRDNSDTYRHAVVTTRFGPMATMLQFYRVLPDQKIEVREFSLASEPRQAGTVYIGLPKELAGTKDSEVVAKIPADDELVFGFGRGLWIARID